MAEQLSRSGDPWWARVGGLGVQGRAMLLALAALFIVLAISSVIYGLWDPRFLVGALFLASAFLCWRTIRWVDRHATWSDRL